MAVITWTPDNMRLKLTFSIILQFLPILGMIFFDFGFLLLYLFTPIPIFCCLYEIFYMSKCRLTFGKKTVIISRPMRKDAEYCLDEVRWSASQIGFRGCNIYLHQGKKKIMKITDGWDHYDFLMTFPHLHPNRLIEIELIKRRNERLKLERKYKGLDLS